MLTELASGAGRLGIELDSCQLSRFEVYYRELVAWNQKTNLTAITDYESIQIKHFLDSLTVALALPCPVPAGLNLLDVGAGAGFPGLPLKILYPEIHLALLEATGKKAAFLDHLINTLELSGIAVIARRAEEAAHLPQYRTNFEVVVSRAVATLPALLEITLPFCRPGGTVIAQKKGDIQAEVDCAAYALGVLGGTITEIKEINLPALSDRRRLVIITRTASTPDIYPRRPGIPAKKPLLS